MKFIHDLIMKLKGFKNRHIYEEQFQKYKDEHKEMKYAKEHFLKDMRIAEYFQHKILNLLSDVQRDYSSQVALMTLFTTVDVAYNSADDVMKEKIEEFMIRFMLKFSDRFHAVNMNDFKPDKHDNHGGYIG